MIIEQLIILAIIQGLTEFLPISSSAHLILLPALTDWPDQGPLMDVAVHVGSLFAVLLYFRRDMVSVMMGMADMLQNRHTQASRLLFYLVIATVPIIVVGGLVHLSGLLDRLRSIEVIAWATIVFGILLYLGDRQSVANRRIQDMSARMALVIGLAQCFALIPGTSRAGVTMTVARYFGFERTEAARFSMLLAVPTISAFGLLAGLDVVRQGDLALGRDAALAVALSFLCAFGAIWFFMRLLERISLTPFVIYRMKTISHTAYLDSQFSFCSTSRCYCWCFSICRYILFRIFSSFF